MFMIVDYSECITVPPIFHMYPCHSLQQALFSGQTESPPSNYYTGGSTESSIKLLHTWQHLPNDLYV